MKNSIHPKYFQATVSCVCGNSFQTGSTMESISTELCSKCHPFFTGTQKLIDTARRVDKFQKNKEKTTALAQTRKGKKAKRIKRATAKKTAKDEASQ